MITHTASALVRADLAYRERQGDTLPYHDRAAVLDAYEDALNLVIWLRQVIEETVLRPPPQPTEEPPEFRAARQRADNEIVPDYGR